MANIRLNDVLLQYWNSLPKWKNGVPRESAINPDELYAIWDDCFLVQLTPDKTFLYDYLGKNLFAAFEGDIAGIESQNMFDTTQHAATAKFHQVIEKSKPLYDEGEFINSKKLLVQYRQQLLPFVNAGGEVIHILGGLRWKYS